MEQSSLELRASSVVLSEPLYFTARDCRAALAREAARLTWLPLGDAAEVADVEVAEVESAPALGGC